MAGLELVPRMDREGTPSEGGESSSMDGELDDSFSDADSEDSGSDDSDDEARQSPLPFDEAHPNMYVPWGMKDYPTEIIEAWTHVHNFALTGPGPELDCYLSKLSPEVLDQPNNIGETVLYMASSRGYASMVGLLLKAGADPNKESLDTFFGYTPLMIATSNCHVECVRTLLSYADVNEKDASGFTALFLAAQCGIGRENVQFIDCPHKEENQVAIRPRNRVILELLLDKGADVNCASKIGLTPLHIAARENNADAVGILLDRGADPLAVYQESLFGVSKVPMTALDIAAEKGLAESLHVFLDKCSFNKELCHRNNAMQIAVKNGQWASIMLLVSAGFDADLGVKLPPDELERYRQLDSSCPLLACIDKTHPEQVKFLLSSGASPLHHGLPFRAPLNRCPLHVAFLKSGEVLQLLLEHCAEMARDGRCRRKLNAQLPLDDVAVWRQPISRFRAVLRAGIGLDLQKAPMAEITSSGCLSAFREVAVVWSEFTDRLSRNLHQIEAVNCVQEIPQALTDLCRIAIRRSIGFPRLAKRSLSVGLLPVPAHLQDYLSYT